MKYTTMNASRLDKAALGGGLRLVPALLAMAWVPAHAADWDVSGQLRQTIAVKTTDAQNGNNQYGNPANGAANVDYSAGGWGAGVHNNGLLAPAADLTRPASNARQPRFNTFSTRADLNFDGKLDENWKATFKLRGVSEQLDKIEDVYKDRSSGSASNAGQFYRTAYGGTGGGPLAYGGRRNSLSLPAAYLDYSSGPLWIRAGNQQIAWGEAIFFRVADVPNGLDLRGQLLGPAAEEYSDTRHSALGLRASYRWSDKAELDSFVQRFAPSVLPNAETPYNMISDQFTVKDKAGYDQVKNKLNVGFRVKGEWEGFGLQAFAVNRHDPNGVYKWTVANAATALPGTAFEVDPSGVWNAAEWLNGAGRMRLNGIEGVASSMNLVAQTLGGVDAYGMSALATACGATDATYGNFRMGSAAAAACVLDSFFGGIGPLRGHISREYKRETVLGGGVNHVFEGEPDTLMDQLIGRFEFSYTPNKKFTNPTLGDYITKNELAFAFIAEKYHKFVSSFPATYFVAQWLHKSHSDLFGRYVGGLNSTVGQIPGGQTGFNGFALAVQQNSPTLEYRFDFSVLTDAKGGWYLQPGVKWKPRKDVQVDLYLNTVYSQHRGQNRDFADGLQHNNELFTRLSYLF